MNSTQNTKHNEKLWTKNFILIICINLITFFGFQMLMPTLPLFVEKLGGSQTEAGFVIGIFALSAVVIRPIAGRGLDVYGRKGIFITGLGIFLISVLVYNWVPTVMLLMALRLVHGLGWGTSSTASGTIASDIIPKKRLAEGMGYFGIAGDIAMAVGPALGLYLTSYLGFTILFLSSAAAIFIAIVLAVLIRFSRDSHRDSHEGAEAHEASKTAYFEKTAIRPSLVMFFITMTFGAIVSFIALYSAQLGISNAGIFFTLYALALMISRPVFGRLADKRGYNILIFPGILAIFAALIILSQAGITGHPYEMLLLAAIIYGFGFGAVQPSLQAMSVRNVPFNRRGAANATFFSSFDLGIGLGSAIWGIAAEHLGYSIMYLIASIAALCALVCYLAFVRAR